jgi:molybdopterin molybdotransferase
MGPGKGIAFGLWEGKPVFCLPGGPASNEMAFIQLALPGILRISGDNQHPLQTVNAVLLEDVKGRHPAWTEYKDAVLERDKEGKYSVRLYKHRSRLQAIASANSLICKPEGKLTLDSGETVKVQILEPHLHEV